MNDGFEGVVFLKKQLQLASQKTKQKQNKQKIISSGLSQLT